MVQLPELWTEPQTGAVRLHHQSGLLTNTPIRLQYLTWYTWLLLEYSLDGPTAVQLPEQPPNFN